MRSIRRADHSSQKRLAVIIGAGPSGLCATKELQQEGFNTLCFDRATDIGGVFRYDEKSDNVGVWRTCRLTSSAYVTSFSDFPATNNAGELEHKHWEHAEYIEYLRRYVDRFNLAPCLRFGHDVTLVEKRAHSCWLVTVQNRSTQVRETIEADVVAICSGLHSVPNIPDLPGLESFSGRIVHSGAYRRPDAFAGEKVVFVGAGESGGEIIDEVSQVAKEAHLSLRRGVVVVPRLINGRPNDYTGTRLLYSLPEFAYRRTDEAALSRRKRLRRLFLPFVIARRALLAAQRGFNNFRHRQCISMPEVSHLDKMFDRVTQKNLRSAISEQDTRVVAMMVALRRTAGGNQFETFATKTEAFVKAIVNGRVTLRPGVRKVRPRTVDFEDGKSAQADTILLCTGYRTIAPSYLEPTVDVTRLYKSMFSPDLPSTIGFIGFLRPPLGAIPPMAEMQARLFARVVAGKCALPHKPVMTADIDRCRMKRAAYFKGVFDRLPCLVDYSTYMDDLAEIIGCKPNVWPLLHKPKLLFKLYTAPFSGAQYRLKGPHATAQIAQESLLAAPSHFLFVRFIDLAIARVATMLGFSAYRPRLTAFGERLHAESDWVQ